MFLRSLEHERLREHAMNICSSLDLAKIGAQVPIEREALVDWVWRAQRMRLDPLRGAPVSPLARDLQAEARAEEALAEEYVMLDGLRLPSYHEIGAPRELGREVLLEHAIACGR